MSAFPPDESPYHWETLPLKPITVAFLATNCIIEVLVLLVVGLRFYSRVTTGSLGWDDWWVLAATILCLGTLINSVCLDVVGSGYYVAEVAINLSTVYLLIFILQALFLFTIMATKMSVCCFYLRVFVGRGMRIATFVTMGLVVSWAVAHYLAAVFICTPVAGQYDLRLAAVTKCGDQTTFFQSGLSINVVLDAIVIALPLWTIWNLNMRTSDKVGLSVAFSIGLAMTAVGIVRAVYVTTTSMTGDITNTLPTNLFLTVFEQQLAIITISIPMLRPLYRRYRARVGGYSIEESEKSGGAADYKPNVTFGGTGKKSKGSRRNADDSIMDTAVELRNVSNKTRIKGPDADGQSLSSDWNHADSGSETALGVSQPRAINVKDEWKVSVS